LPFLRARDEQDARFGAQLTLFATRNLVQKLSGESLLDLDRCLEDLLLGIEALDVGVVEQIFKPSRSNRHRPASLRWARLRGRAAGTAELFYRSGLDLSEACDLVARVMTSAGYRRSGRRDRNAITRWTIKGWRKEASEAASGSLLRRTFDNLMDASEGLERPDRFLLAEFALADLGGRKST
jgi:hypothetical protein